MKARPDYCAAAGPSIPADTELIVKWSFTCLHQTHVRDNVTLGPYVQPPLLYGNLILPSQPKLAPVVKHTKQ